MNRGSGWVPVLRHRASLGSTVEYRPFERSEHGVENFAAGAGNNLIPNIIPSDRSALIMRHHVDLHPHDMRAAAA